MPSLPLQTNDKTARLGPGFTPGQVRYERLEPSSTLAVDGPALQIRCTYQDYESSGSYDLLDYISGAWQGSVYIGDRSGRIHAIFMLIPEAPFQMKTRLQALFQQARGGNTRKGCLLNYRLIEDTLDLQSFAYPGHWLLGVMFP